MGAVSAPQGCVRWRAHAGAGASETLFIHKSLFLSTFVVFTTEVVAAIVVLVAVIAVFSTVIVVVIFLFTLVVIIAFEFVAAIVVVVAMIAILAAVIIVVLFFASVVIIAFEVVATIAVVVAVIPVLSAVRGWGLRQGAARADGHQWADDQTRGQQFERVAPGGPVELLRPAIKPASIHHSSSVMADLHEANCGLARICALPPSALTDRIGYRPARRG